MSRKLGQVALIALLGLECCHFPRESVAATLTENQSARKQKSDAFPRLAIPWSQRRGIESIDRNAEVILVRVPLNRLSNALAAKAMESRRDVLDSEILVSGYFVLAYQLVGHSWSIMVPDSISESGRFAAASPPREAELSKQLGQPVIRLIVSDTEGIIGYELFEKGELVEYFAGSEGTSMNWANGYGLPAKRYALSPYPDDPEAKQVAHFWSRRRQIRAREIGSIWSFAEQFLIEQDAFDPAIDARDFLGESYPKRGGRYRVQNPESRLVLGAEAEVVSVRELVRVDYFRFGN